MLLDPIYGGLATTTSYLQLNGSSSASNRSSLVAADPPKMLPSVARDARSLAGYPYRENNVESSSVAAEPSAIGRACA